MHAGAQRKKGEKYPSFNQQLEDCAAELEQRGLDGEDVTFVRARPPQLSRPTQPR